MDLPRNIISVRQLFSNDFFTIKEFHVNCSIGYLISDLSFNTYLSNTKHYVTYGAFNGKNLIGYIMFLHNLDEADIVYVLIHPTMRRLGIATFLINTAHSQLKFDKLYLEVNSNNYNAIQFYNYLGFVKLSIRKKYSNGIDAYLMIKTFNSNSDIYKTV